MKIVWIKKPTSSPTTTTFDREDKALSIQTNESKRKNKSLREANRLTHNITHPSKIDISVESQETNHICMHYTFTNSAT